MFYHGVEPKMLLFTISIIRLCILYYRAVTLLNLHRSFAAEGFYGVSEGCADGLNTDRQQGNGKGDGAGHKEDPPADLRTIGKLIEPFVHSPPRGRKGDERCDPDEESEVF